MRASPHWLRRVFWDKVGEWQQMWGGGLARVSDSLVGSCVWLSQGLPFSHADSRGGWLYWRRSLPSTPPREPSRPRSTWTRCRRPEVRALAPSRGKECRDPCTTCSQGSRLTLGVRGPGPPDGVRNSWSLSCASQHSTIPCQASRILDHADGVKAHHLALLEELRRMLECNRPCIKTPSSAADGA